MSDNVRSYGFIAVLKEPLHKDVLDDVREQLYDAKSNLSVNYEGTLIYSDLNRHESYRVKEDICSLQIGNGSSYLDFAKELTKLHYDIDPATILPYNCVWYNGADNPVDMLTLEEYKAKLV